MAFNTGGHLAAIENLLVLVDAGNPKSYTSGTTIKNLAGKGTFINYGGAGVSGSQPTQRIVFDGVSDIAQYVGTPATLQGDPSFTVFGAFYRTGTMSAEGCWGIGTSSTLDGYGSYNGGAPNDIAIDLWGDSTITTGNDYPLNEWVLVHWVKTAGALNTTNLSIWRNDFKETGAQLTVLRGGSNTPTIGNAGLVLGRTGYSVSAYYGPVDYGFWAVWDKALSDHEVMQNFEAKRTRYGI